MIYLQCPATLAERAEGVHAAMGEWMRSSAMRDLVTAFGGDIPRQNDLTSLNLWLQEFSARWDYRAMQQRRAQERGEFPVERWSVGEDGNLTAEQTRLVAAASEQLGLIGIDTPRKAHYDYMVVLGGARMSNLLRSRHAARLLENGVVSARQVILLSCLRPVAEAERETTNTYAPDARTEYDLLNSGAERSFAFVRDYQEDCYSSPESANLDWAIRSYNSASGHPTLTSLAAPSSRPDERRANSADTFSFFMSRCGAQSGDSLLLVTSQIYVPYQQMEALRTLAMPNGLVVETIGHPSEPVGNSTVSRQWSNYLQETRSTLVSMGRFLEQYPVGS